MHHAEAALKDAGKLERTDDAEGEAGKCVEKQGERRHHQPHAVIGHKAERDLDDADTGHDDADGGAEKKKNGERKRPRKQTEHDGYSLVV